MRKDFSLAKEVVFGCTISSQASTFCSKWLWREGKKNEIVLEGSTIKSRGALWEEWWKRVDRQVELYSSVSNSSNRTAQLENQLYNFVYGAVIPFPTCSLYNGYIFILYYQYLWALTVKLHSLKNISRVLLSVYHLPLLFSCHSNIF